MLKMSFFSIILSGKDIKISGLDAIFNLKTQKVVRLNRNSASTYSLVMAPEVLPTRTMSRKVRIGCIDRFKFLVGYI